MKKTTDERNKKKEIKLCVFVIWKKRRQNGKKARKINRMRKDLKEGKAKRKKQKKRIRKAQN